MHLICIMFHEWWDHRRHHIHSEDIGMSQRLWCRACLCWRTR
jgi:hypothetical protein